MITWDLSCFLSSVCSLFRSCGKVLPKESKNSILAIFGFTPGFCMLSVTVYLVAICMDYLTDSTYGKRCSSVVWCWSVMAVCLIYGHVCD